MVPVLETRSISKTYRIGLRGESVHALQNVSLSVSEGQVFALLGLNGAGKSTLTKIFLDLVRANSGEVLLFGEPARTSGWKRHVGYLPELFSAPGSMTVRGVLRYLGQLSGMRGSMLNQRVNAELEELSLTDLSARRVSTLSKGNVLRLGIAQALLHQPRLLFLDEPTEGLDPAGRRMIRNLLIRLSTSGVTILLNSHLLSEVELVAHRLGILHHGTLVASGSLSDLLPRHQRFQVEIGTVPPDEHSWHYAETAGMWTREVEGADDLQRLLSSLKTIAITPLSVKPMQTTLEDVFLEHISGQDQ